jgi:endonuclease IV
MIISTYFLFDLTMLRVRQVIPFLDLLTMVKILPSPQILKATDISNHGTAPRLATLLGFSDYGLFMEKIFHESLNDIPDYHNMKLNYIPSEYHSKFIIKDYEKYGKLFRDHFVDAVSVKEQVEWTCEKDNIQGHPDVVYGDTVYDIKTSGQFNYMRKDTRYQLLAYYCLAQITGNTHINNVGIIAPFQNKIITYDLEKWDWKKYWSKMCEAGNLLLEQRKMWLCQDLEYIVFMQMVNATVGSHIGKTNVGLRCKQRPGIPFQFFISGNTNTNIKYTPAFEKTVKSISGSNPLFIHAPYSLNLSNPYESKKVDNKDGNMWVCKKYSKILDFGNRTGIGGVVIHTGRMGSSKEKEDRIDEETAVKNMRDSIIECSKSVVSCVILLETPAGQKGETLDSIDKFVDFYKSLPDEIKWSVQVCVDTCHVFANGFDPYNYLVRLKDEGIPIGLIHYNESKMKCGCRKDRHAPVGGGWIGFETMNKVLGFSLDNNIPCVFE